VIFQILPRDMSLPYLARFFRVSFSMVDSKKLKLFMNQCDGCDFTKAPDSGCHPTDFDWRPPDLRVSKTGDFTLILWELQFWSQKFLTWALLREPPVFKIFSSGTPTPEVQGLSSLHIRIPKCSCRKVPVKILKSL
jgi:hypothetical protein